MTETAAAIADQAREGCPPWCTADDHPRYKLHKTDRWPEDRDGHRTLVSLRQFPWDPRPWLGIIDVTVDDPAAIARLLRRFGQEKIAAAVEELAALAGGGSPPIG